MAIPYRSAFRLLPLFLVLAAVPAAAQVANGEIGLTGYVKSKDPKRNLLVLSVRSFMLPNGNRNSLAKPKFKTVLLTADTVIYSAGVAPKLTLSNLAIGKLIFVIGPDSGTGKPITAREIDLMGRIINR